jgi:hypothetical protein
MKTVFWIGLLNIDFFCRNGHLLFSTLVELIRIFGMIGSEIPYQTLPTSQAIARIVGTLTGALVFGSYTGCLVSFLAVQRISYPINEYRDLTWNPELKLNIPNSSVFISQITNSLTSLEESTIFNHNVIYVKPIYMADLKRLVTKTFNDPNTLILNSEKELESALQGTEMMCNLLPIPELCTTSPVGWMFPKHSILPELFDVFTKKIQASGLIHYIENHYLSHKDCGTQQPKVVVGFELVGILFYILIGGIIIATLLSLIEKILK